MPLTLITGPANAAKAGAVLERLRGALPRDPVLVVPTAADVAHYQRELAASGVVFGAEVHTFSRLIREIAARAGVAARPLGPVARDRVVRAAVAEVPLRVLARSAATPGFADAAGALFAELQRSLVGPARFTAALRAWGAEAGRAAYAAELAALYAAYRRRLEALGRPDAEGLAWAALDALRAAPAAWGARPVFFYGFDDLTRLERDAVETLARHAEVCVALPYEPGRVAFAGRAATVEELRPLADEVLHLPERAEHYAPDARPALHHLERRLFEPAAPRRPPNGALRLLEAGGERAEAELVGAAVLELMRQGVAPADIAVLLRGDAGVAALFAQVLAGYGIPVSHDRRVPLGRTRLGAGVLAAARAALPGGTAADLLTWLRTPGCLPDPSAADRLEAHVRRAEVAGAREARAHWEGRVGGPPLVRLDALAAAPGPDALLAALEREADALWTAPHHRRGAVLAPEDVADARVAADLRGAVAELRALGAADPALLGSTTDVLDALAAVRVREPSAVAGAALATPPETALAAPTVRASAPPPAGAPPSFPSVVASAPPPAGAPPSFPTVVASAPPPAAAPPSFPTVVAPAPPPPGVAPSFPTVVAPAPPPPGVLLADPLAIRARRFRAVFVCGLQEGEFPRRPRPEPFLADDDRRDLARASGLVLPLHEDVLDAERSLFYAAVSRPEDALFLSWRASDEEGDPLTPSPFLDDVRSLFTDELWDSRGTRLLADVTWAPRDAPTPHELHRAFAGAREEPEPPPLSPPASAAVLAMLAGRGPEPARGVEAFAACGVRWLVEQVLDPAATEPDPEPMRRGSLAHAVLERTLRLLGERTGAARVTQDTLDVVLAALRDALAEQGAGSERGTRARRRATLHGLEVDLERYLRREAECGAGYGAAHLEWRFGGACDEYGPLVLARGDGDGDGDGDAEPAAVSGRVDRVDVGPGGAALVHDYKGRTVTPGARWTDQRQLQVGLYVLAVRELLGHEPVAGLYQPLAGRKLDPRGLVRDGAPGRYVRTDVVDADGFDATLEAVRALAVRTIDDIRAGRVRACPERCSPRGCRYPGICRAGENGRDEGEASP